MNELVFHTRELPEGITSVERLFEAESFGWDEFASILPDPVELSIRIQKTEHIISISGKSSGRYQYECSRCLKDFRESFEIPVEQKWSTEDLETTNSGRLDLGAKIREDILINVDERPLCEIDCKGLCAGCGADLNNEACRCSPD